MKEEFNLRKRFKWRFVFLLLFLLTCADARGKKNYIEDLENQRFEETKRQALIVGQTVELTDADGLLHSRALRDAGGTGIVAGLDLDNDGVLDIHIDPFSLNRITAFSFLAPADIDNDGTADYYFYFRVIGSEVKVQLLTANRSDARPVAFMLDVSNIIIGIDLDGDGVSDDARLDGKEIAGPVVVAQPVYSPIAGPFATPQNVSITTATSGAILCYTNDTVTTPRCNIAKNGCVQGSLYSSPLTVANDQTVAAVACRLDAEDSPITVGSYVVDTTPPSIAAGPLSGLFSRPQKIILTGAATTGQGALNGSLLPSEICYTWGADASGNPMPGVIPADPTFPCTPSNNIVAVSGQTGELTLGCDTQASVTDPLTDPNTCSFTSGVYTLKYIATDIVGNTTTVQTQSYAIGVNPVITTNTAPELSVWTTTNNWGNTATNTAARATTNWVWQTDFPGDYEIRINDASLGCTSGTLSTGANATGTAAALTPVTVTINAADLDPTQLNSVKVCLIPTGDTTPTSKTEVLWRLQPKDANAIYAKVNYNKAETATFDIDADLFQPISAIKSLTFSVPAASKGPDSNNSAVLPTCVGTPNAQGVCASYQIPASLTANVTTLVYDIAITVCDTSGCAAPAVSPTWNTGASSGTATLKVFILKDKTPGNSIFADASGGNDGWTGVNRTNNPAGTGPVRTLANAMTKAAGGKAVYIVTGNYCASGAPACLATTGKLAVPANTSVYGGFTSAWLRPDVASNRANITAGSNNSADSIGIELGAVNTPVWVEGLNLTTQAATPDLVSGYNTVGLQALSGSSTLTLYKNNIVANSYTGSAGPNPGGSYGLKLQSINTAILTSNTIQASSGSPGLSGAAGGANGSPGGNGGNGADGVQGCLLCSNDNRSHASGGTGGTGGEGGTNRGGNGGQGGWQDDGANDGSPGETAPGGGGSGGSAGTANCNGNGGPGGNGAAGGNGPDGAAAGSAVGQITGGFIKAYQGHSGSDGTPGTGGGGGGGGGGADCNWSDGGSGGGGGAGAGGKGTGGEGGWGGGPSVGIFFYSVSNITMTSNAITRGTGGNAGSGKAGGIAGPPGNFGSGGAAVDDGGAGGNGGVAGTSGNGGAGSGGNGGQSFGMAVYPNITPSCSGNTYTGGGGGSGGTALGVAGTNAACFKYTSTTAGTACTCN